MSSYELFGHEKNQSRITFQDTDKLQQYFEQIENYDVSYCKLSSPDIPIQLISHSNKLQRLNLAGNFLNNFTIQIENVSSLQYIDLSSSDILRASPIFPFRAAMHPCLAIY